MPSSSERLQTASVFNSELRNECELRAIRHALAGLGDALITTDTQARVASLNSSAERLTAWRSDEAAGMPLESLLRILDGHTGHEIESPAAQALRANALVGRARHRVRVARSGAQLVIEVSAAPIRDACDMVCGAVMLLRDVSEQCRTEEALSAADRRKDEFLATLAHELRNPLAPIRQATVICRAPAASEAQKRWSLEVIERQVRNISLLLDDLLDISRVTRGVLSLRVQSIELAALIDAALETTRPLIDAKRHHLSVQIPPQPVRFDADPLRMAQILANLLANAAKYTEPEGHIRLTASVVADEIVMRVSDTGIGIAPETLPRVFEMFAQVHRRGAAEGGGLGIGLALTKGLVELHGGRIEAHSAGPGHGSEFTVWLSKRAAVVPPPPRSASAVTPVAQRRVLIADDNRDSAETLAALLRMDGHEVEVVHDGPKALSAFADFRPDVVLLDIGMPGLNGYDVALRIRQVPTARLVKLIAITGWGLESDRVQAFASGFDHHLTKPVEWQRVAELVRSGAHGGGH